MSAKSQLQFLTWLRKKHPQIYSVAIERVQNAELASLGEGDSIWTKILNGVTAAGTTYLGLKNQKDMLELNIARANQGLPPLDAGATAPVVKTQIDLPPDVIATISQGAKDTTNKILMIGGAAVLGLFALKAFKR